MATPNVPQCTMKTNVNLIPLTFHSVPLFTSLCIALLVRQSA